MLYTELKSIYNQKTFLKDSYPFEEFFPQVKAFINDEVRLGAKYLNPYRFAFKYGYDTQKMLTYFLALSEEDKILTKIYKYDCPCGETNLLTTEELKHFTCTGCYDEENLINANVLHEIQLLFKINKDLLDDVKNNLKVLSSSKAAVSMKQNLEEDKIITLNDALQANLIQENTVDPSLEIIEHNLYNRLTTGLSKTS
ncbi:hypothetical protein P4414_04195 [Bacillus thuringiensis]|nr:hypothetical protein [Bacillus thuringiensis]